jgi:hypothetical protein
VAEVVQKKLFLKISGDFFYILLHSIDMSSFVALSTVCPICEIYPLSEKDKMKDNGCFNCRSKAKKQAEHDTVREFFFVTLYIYTYLHIYLDFFLQLQYKTRITLKKLIQFEYVDGTKQKFIFYRYQYYR